MNISNIDDYKDILYHLLKGHQHFEVALQEGIVTDKTKIFMSDNLSGLYNTFADLRIDIEKIVVPKKPFVHKYQLFSDKIIAFLYSNLMSFARTSKVNGIPISKKFISNISSILKNTHCVHHSNVTGDIIGYSHTFCNRKARENCYRIPVIAHNLFRFDFFFFLVKGIRASVWKTRDIVIRGKNPTDISFAHIGNQVQFIDTIKYFQQSLAALANSLTISEKASIYEECKNYIKKDEELIKNFLLLSETDKEWVLDYLSSGKGTIHL